MVFKQKFKINSSPFTSKLIQFSYHRFIFPLICKVHHVYFCIPLWCVFKGQVLRSTRFLSVYKFIDKVHRVCDHWWQELSLDMCSELLAIGWIASFHESAWISATNWMIDTLLYAYENISLETFYKKRLKSWRTRHLELLWNVYSGLSSPSSSRIKHAAMDIISWCSPLWFSENHCPLNWLGVSSCVNIAVFGWWW